MVNMHEFVVNKPLLLKEAIILNISAMSPCDVAIVVRDSKILSCSATVRQKNEPDICVIVVTCLLSHKCQHIVGLVEGHKIGHESKRKH